MCADPVAATRPTFRLNGDVVSIPAHSNSTTLLEFIRARGLTGAKEGCAEGECGACAVAVIAPSGTGCEYRPVNSCLMLLPAVADHEVYTVESLAGSGALTDAQQALAAAGGSQCGYCTPGFAVSLFAEHYRPGRTGPCEEAALSGNLCRCTGYRPIADAARALGHPPPGVFRDRLDHPAPAPSEVVDAGCSRPVTLARTLEILGERPDATMVCGGTDVGVDVNLRGRRLTHMVALDEVAELKAFVYTQEAITIGAALSLTDLGHAWPDAPAAVHEWLDRFASPLVRNRATLGGNLATASPIGDAAPLLLALDARVTLASAGQLRSLPLCSFFTAYRRTAMRPGEIILDIQIPLPLPDALRFYKASKRRLDDISTVAAAMALTFSGRRISKARLAFGGVAATPVRVTAAEEILTGGAWNQAAVEAARGIVEGTLTPLSDQRGSKEYRRAVASSLVEKFWCETRGDAGELVS